MHFINHPLRQKASSCPETSQRLATITQTLCASIPVLTPYYSQMTFVDVTGMMPHAAAIDRFGRFYYNADRLKEMTNEELAFVIQHETLHVLMGHPERVQKFYHLLDAYLLKQMGLEHLRDNQLFLHVLQNITAIGVDIEVDHSIPNEVGTPMGPLRLKTTDSHEEALKPVRQLPGVDATRSMEFNSIIALKHFAQILQEQGNDPVMATIHFTGMDAFLKSDEFRQALEREMQQQQTGQQGGQQTGQQGGQQTGQQGGQSVTGSGQSSVPGHPTSSDSWSGGLDCGRKTFGHPRVKADQVGPDLELPIDGRYPVPPIDNIKRQIFQEIMDQEALQADPNSGCQGRGNIPSGLIRYAVQVSRPTVDYILEFEQQMQELAHCGRVEQDILRPHPIFAAYEELALQGYFPEPPIPESDVHYSCTLGILVDTSGSVSDAEVAFARESVASILNRQKFSRMVLCSVDAAVHFCREINRVDPAMFRGNGGTDLVEGFNALLRQDVDAILVFTDQETPWPEFRVNVPVVVVSHQPRHRNLPPEYVFFQIADPDLKVLTDALDSSPSPASSRFSSRSSSPAPSPVNRAKSAGLSPI